MAVTTQEAVEGTAEEGTVEEGGTAEEATVVRCHSIPRQLVDYIFFIESDSSREEV